MDRILFKGGDRASPGRRKKCHHGDATRGERRGRGLVFARLYKKTFASRQEGGAAQGVDSDCHARSCLYDSITCIGGR